MLKESAAGVQKFIQKARQHMDITELTPVILRMFISKIAVHENAAGQ